MSLLFHWGHHGIELKRWGVKHVILADQLYGIYLEKEMWR